MRAKWKCICLAALVSAVVLPAQAAFKVVDIGGRLEIRDEGKTVFGWQHQPLSEPKGGAIFATSAFIHPLCTPSGFMLTRIQPDDHLHHLGLWWPWKTLTVDGKKYVTWEVQEKQGRHIAVSARVTRESADEVVIEGINRTEINLPEKGYQPMLEEKVVMRFSRMGADAYLLDIDIAQQPIDGIGVTVSKYHYSGFSWRGPEGWNQDNSTMRTSGGQDRDHANHQPADWVSVDGKTSPQGMATMLMMSGASQIAGAPELLRVWGSNMEKGTPFANLNPVAKQPVELNAQNKSVSQRRYRVVIADRAILPEESDKLWKEWQKK